MSTLRQQIDNRSIFIMMLIALLCITTIAYALTWLQLYNALDAFLNGKGIWDTVTGQIKTLEEKINSLEEVRDELNEMYRQASAEVILWIASHDGAKTNLKAAEKTLADAERATYYAEINKGAAENVIEISVYYEYNSYLSWFNHHFSCLHQSSCSECDRLYNLWQHYISELAQDRKDLKAAKKEVKKCKKAEKKAGKEVELASFRVSLFELEVRAKKMALKVIEIDQLTNGFLLIAENAELFLKQQRKKELEKQKPIVQTYMDDILHAWEYPDFDFQAYIMENPPPPIIFEEE